jgi:radical SAM superfamily enzyme YgiQ (UPF0313 family)
VARPRVFILQMTPSGEGLAGRHSRLWYHGLTLPYLAGLFGRHAEVTIRDELLDAAPTPEELQGAFDLIAISVMGAALPRALNYADALREAGIKVVMGGPTASAYRERVLPHVSSLVCGDGEELIDQLMEDFQAGNLQPIYQHKSIQDLSDTPIPRYDLVDRKRVGIYFPVEGSRGCPVGCNFCLTSHMAGRKQRLKPIAHVLRDIQALKDLGIHRVTFTDDNPIANRERFCELVSAITPMKVRWITNATADIAEDGDLLRQLAASGCETLSIGFETVEPASIADAGKGSRCKPKGYRKAVERIHAAGMQVLAMMVVGFDHDTVETFDAVRDFLVGSKVDIAVFHVLTPTLGTPFYQQMQEEDRLLTMKLEDYSAERAVFRPARMTAKELDEGFWRLYREVYSYGNIARRLLTRWPGPRPLGRLSTLAANLYLGYHARRGRTIV